MRMAAPPVLVSDHNPISAPTDLLEERRDLRGRAIRILAMWEMPDTGKQRDIEIGEGLAQAIGPRKRKQRIALGPAHAGRQLDRRKLGRLAFHHLDPAGMGSAVMREAACEVAG